MLRLLLDFAWWRDATYVWGYPLYATFRKDQRPFTLRMPHSLPALFNLLGTELIEVRNWLTLLPRSAGHVNPLGQRGDFPPRQQRGHETPSPGTLSLLS